MGRISNGRSASPAPRPSSSRFGTPPRRRYRARFYPKDAPQLRDLFEIVGRFDGTDVLIDDRPVPYARELWLPLFWFLIR